MTASLGIDHALVCVNDITAARETYLALGFLSRGFSQHPWGTSTTALLFKDQLFEIVGIGDSSLLDGYEAGGFRFGRHVEAHLAKREGVPLTALNSDDAVADEAALTARGVDVTGTIDFGRDVIREDGKPDRTRTRLKVLANSRYPRLSLFACQQFRRDLIEYPEWMAHPNGVTGIAGLTVIAEGGAFDEAVAWFERVHDATAEPDGPGAARVPTARGAWTVTGRAGFATRYGAIPDFADATLPSIAGVDLRTQAPETVAERAVAAGLRAETVGAALALPEAKRLGGVALRFGRFDG
jgi:hypothetical protein